MKFFTIGYEGLSIEEFVAALVKNKIGIIADVRKNPVSRKKGFSKRQLGKALEEAGIKYRHFPGLGVPTEWRKKAKNEEITRKKMFRDYVRKILPKQGEDLDVLGKILKREKLSLLCYEADFSDCHRKFVADELLERGAKNLSVKNLTVERKSLF